MTIENWNRVRTPEAGEDILATWPKTAASIAHIVHVDTYDEAVNICNAAARAGQPPTQARPIYFDLSNHIHKCEGRKGQRGLWELTRLTPVIAYGSAAGNWVVGGKGSVPAQKASRGRSGASHRLSPSRLVSLTTASTSASPSRTAK